MAGGALVVLGLTAVLVPLANAAISRRCEYAADRFAADHGLAIELAAALRVLSDGNPAPRGWSRLWSTHPTCEQRIAALQTATLIPGHAVRDRQADVRSAGLAGSLFEAR
jgi:STE24 endopeptidase